MAPDSLADTQAGGLVDGGLAAEVGGDVVVVDGGLAAEVSGYVVDGGLGAESGGDVVDGGLVDDSGSVEGPGGGPDRGDLVAANGDVVDVVVASAVAAEMGLQISPYELEVELANSMEEAAAMS